MDGRKMAESAAWENKEDGQRILYDFGMLDDGLKGNWVFVFLELHKRKKNQKNLK